MILVTGGAGYVGSHFLNEYLKDNSNEVVVIDNLTRGHKAALPPERSHFFNCSLGDKKAVEEVFSKFDITHVVHFAALAYVAESQEEPFKYFANNVVETLNLFEVMENHGVRKLVFSSTCATYGVPQYVPIDEKHQQKPVNAYGNTKLIVEHILESLAQTKKWSFVALRYFNAAGAAADGSIGECHENETHLIPLVLQTALGKQKSLRINGGDYETADGTCVRDYIHVTDLANAHLQALDLLNKVPGTAECLNLGTEKGASVMEIINLCKEITGREIIVEVAPRRFGDPPTLVADASKAKKLLGWEAKHDLRSIVQTAWHWEQNRRY